jgi:RNA polymerase sigma factor (sigma-70 family)
MLGSVHDAEDAVQQTFLAAHSDIVRSGERDLHVKAWLYTIARNRCLSTLRARRERPADDQIEIVSDRFAQDVQQREDLRALLADIHKLPDDQREALVLAEVGDLSHSDISAILGCEASKVKALVFQARTALIDRRSARDTSCEEIREQIATLRGGALRRSHLRHHIEACPGCAQFRNDVRHQRAMLAVALPVVPSAALRANVLGALGVGGGSTAIGVGGGGFAVAIQSSAAKVGIAVALAAGGGGAAVATTNGLPGIGHSDSGASSSSVRSLNGNLHAGTSAATAVGGQSAATAVAGAQGKSKSHDVSHSRSASGTEHGFTPTQRQSNGDAAKQFATTRGDGNHTGITKDHTNNSHAPATRRGQGQTKHTAKVHATPVPKTPKTRVEKTHVAPTPRAEPAPKTDAATPTPTPQSQVPADPGATANGQAGSGGKSLGAVKKIITSG